FPGSGRCVSFKGRGRGLSKVLCRALPIARSDGGACRTAFAARPRLCDNRGSKTLRSCERGGSNGQLPAASPAEVCGSLKSAYSANALPFLQKQRSTEKGKRLDRWRRQF